MGPVWVKVDAAGRLVIPKEMREALGIPDGGELRLKVEDGELLGMGRIAALRRIQRELRGTVPPGTSVVDELIADRRAEAAREEAEERAWEEQQRSRDRKPAAWAALSSTPRPCSPRCSTNRARTPSPRS